MKYEIEERYGEDADTLIAVTQKPTVPCLYKKKYFYVSDAFLFTVREVNTTVCSEVAK